MIIAITVVMLMTLIPLAIFSQAIQQLPLARHDQDHESALAAAEAGVDDYLNRLAQNSNYWTYSAAQPAAGRQPRLHSVRCRCRARTPTASASATRPNTSQTASTGIVYLTSSGKSLTTSTGPTRPNDPYRELGLRRQGFLDYLWLTDYEITDPVLSGANARARARSTPGSGTRVRNKYGPERRESTCQRRVLDVAVRPQRAGALERRSVRVRQPDVQRRHRHVLQLADEPTTCSTARSSAGPASVLNPLALCEQPDRTRANDPASGSILPFPPANTSIQHQADGAARRHRLPVHGTDDDHAAQLGTGKMDVSSPDTSRRTPVAGPGTT